MPDYRSVLRRSFQTRLALILALTGVAGALLTAVLVNVAFQGRFDNFLQKQATDREDRLLSLVAASYIDSGGWDAQALAVLTPTAVMSGAEVTVYDTAERRIWSTADSPMGAAMGQQMMGGEPLGQPRRLPVVVAGQEVGTVTVAVPGGAPSTEEQDFRDAVNRLLIFGVAVAAVAAAAVGVFLARRATQPVRALTAAADGLAAGDRTRRVEVDRVDEFGALATAFNTMADTVEREERVRRSFSADVAHELRTPLAILRGQVEAAQDGLGEPGPTVLASLHQEILRLSRLVGDLETMTSADAAGFHLQLEPTALDALVGAVVVEMRERLADAAITVDTRLAPVTVIGDPDRLRQVVSNLVTNAVKFVPAGGRVTVTVDTDGRAGTARLRVADDGPGFDPDELPHVFRRFFRGDRARAGGSGIGLAVVQELVRAHGGRVTAGNQPGGGAILTVWLPGIASTPHSTFTVPSQPVPNVEDTKTRNVDEGDRS